jgi:hypothetical protein
MYALYICLTDIGQPIQMSLHPKMEHSGDS